MIKTSAGLVFRWWNDAIAGKPDRTFQYHHQPFVYFSIMQTIPGTTAHLKDETEFIAAAQAGTLRRSLLSNLSVLRMNPGYADIVTGEKHVKT
jgi:phospholipase C